MERALNILRGCARVEVRGAAPLRLLDRMASAGVAFWRTEPVDGFTLRFTLHSRDLARVRALAERSLCTLEPISELGGRETLRRLRRRGALSVCAAALLLGILLSSFFVWEIEISGNQRVSDGAIYRALEDSGVYVGACWPAFSGDMIRNDVILRLPDLSWIGVNVRSSRARVIVRERVEKPALYDAKTPVDIVSAATGIITKMIVLEGVPLVQAGDAVLPGETLVTGRWESAVTGAVRYAHARAEIEARSWYELNARTELTVLERSYTGSRRSRWALELGRRRINFYDISGNPYASCDKIIAEWPMALEGVFTLPLTLVRESLTEYELTPVRRDRAGAEAELKAALLAELDQRLDGRGEAVQTDFSVSESGGVLTVTLRAECREDIALEAPMDEIPR